MNTTKTSLVPDEDQGVVFVNVSTAAGSSLKTTNDVMMRIEKMCIRDRAAIGIPEEELRKAAKSAVCKINIDSVSYTHLDVYKRQQSTLVFCNHRESVERVGKYLQSQKFQCGIFHGDRKSVV